jgi:uncharacterized LabA/DUF88 family protein
MALNYFFIDGSALTSQIRALRKKHPSFNNRKLDPKLLINHYSLHLPELINNEFKRATFYFPKGDESNISEYIISPDHKNPGQVRDLNFKFCGYKLKGSTGFAEFVEKKVPKKWKDRFSKSEKGIDIEICCDALKLASAGKIDRLFLLTNDDDFAPFCRTIKEFGTNISIIYLSSAVNCNISLVQEADSYDVVPIGSLQQMFFPIPAVPPPAAEAPDAQEDVSVLKTDAAPSALTVKAPSKQGAPPDEDDIPEAEG